MNRWYWRAGLLLLAVMLVQSGALAITVIVNGQPLPAYPPAIERGGRVLLPMRMVFEAVGAQVTWEAVTQTAVGVRGDITVRMTINSNLASINDRAVSLDVPPQLIGGSTYMPVRFPAEAFGASVGWNGASQVVTITLADLPGGGQPGTGQPGGNPPPPPLPPPVTPPPPVEQQPQPGTVTGVVSAALIDRVVVTLDGQLQPYLITPNTIVLRQNEQVTADMLRPGDLAQIQHDGLGSAVIVRASFDSVEGKVLATLPNQIMLDNRNDVLRVQPAAEIVALDGAPAQFSDIRTQDRVRLRLTPGTSDVYGIAMLQQGATDTTQPPAAGPRIEQFYHDAAGPLKAGDLLRVTLKGTPGGTASFDVGEARRGIVLTELQAAPGTYAKSYRVETGLNAIGVPLIGHLSVGGVTADLAQSTEPVTLDSTPPVVQVFGLQQGDQTANRQPNLSILLTDENGSGVDFDNSTVTLRAGTMVRSAQVTRQGQYLSVVPDPLPAGPVTVTVLAYDLAGNQTQRQWTFTITGGISPTQTLSVSHNAAAALMPGDELIITALGPPGGQATVDLGTWEQGLQLPESYQNPGTYTESFVIPDISQDMELTVVAYLHMPSGQNLSAQATTPVRLGQQRLLAPTLLSPTAGAHAGEQVVVEGDTQPQASVAVQITWHGTMLAIFDQSGQIVDTQVTADDSGHFMTEPISLKVQSLVSVKNVTYTLTVVARNAHGEESAPLEVQFVK